MDNLVLFPDEDAPQNFVAAVIASSSISLFLFLANTYYLIKVGSAYFRTTREKQKGILRLLIGQLFFTGLTCAWAGAVAATKKSVDTCFYTGSAGAFTYCMSFVFSYLILLNRAKAVNEWEQTKCFSHLHSSITIAVYGMGVFSIGACFVSHGKTFFKQGYCAMVTIVPDIAWITLLMDSILSFTLLYLFAGPMLIRLKMTRTREKQLESLETDEETSILEKAARRNFLVSSIQIFSTFISLLLVFCSNLILTNSTHVEVQALNMTNFIIAPIDTSINVLCSLVMVKKVWRRTSKIQASTRSGLSRGVRPSAGPIQRS